MQILLQDIKMKLTKEGERNLKDLKKIHGDVAGEKTFNLLIYRHPTFKKRWLKKSDVTSK